jgi:hypothetical protein
MEGGIEIALSDVLEGIRPDVMLIDAGKLNIMIASPSMTQSM